MSRSDIFAWLHLRKFDTENVEAVKAKIQDIYDDSKQNYGVPKITVELRKPVKSFRKNCWYIICAKWESVHSGANHDNHHKDLDFSTELQNILDEQFNPDHPNAVWCSDITYIWTMMDLSI